MDKRKFLANLNVFIPLFAYGFSFLMASDAALIMQPSQFSDSGVYDPFDYSAQPFMVLAWVGVLILMWATVGLSPKGHAPGRERRRRLGDALLATINLAAFSAALLPLLLLLLLLLLANLTGIEAIGHLMWFGLPVLVIAHCVWQLGLLMVWTSRGALPLWPAQAPHAKSSTRSSPANPSIQDKTVPSTAMKSRPLQNRSNLKRWLFFGLRRFG